MPNEAITAAGASGTPGITLCSAGLRRIAAPGAAPGWSRFPRLLLGRRREPFRTELDDDENRGCCGPT